MRILAIFAILLAPASMMGNPAAMAQPMAPSSASHQESAAGEGSHCAEMNGANQENDRSAPQRECFSECAVTCAAIPVLGGLLREPVLLLALPHPDPLMNWMRGLNPESVDPPPRTA
jgi:hypothetical protein